MHTSIPRSPLAAGRLARAAGVAACASLAMTAAAHAGAFTDGTNDFLPSYGQGLAKPLPKNPDLDVIGGSVTFDQVKGLFTLTAKVVGPIGYSFDHNNTNVAYVWGMNTGTANPKKPGLLSDGSIAHTPGLQPDLLVDETIVVKSNKQMFVQMAYLANGTPVLTPTLYAGDVEISNSPAGGTISGTISLADIASQFKAAGFRPDAAFASPLDYTFGLWPKFGTGWNSIIADFGPDHGVITAAGGVPEPASWALMICGFGMAGAMVRRRRAVARAA